MRRWRWAALALAAAWWLIDLGALGAGVPAPLDDTWEYGVVARHLLAGDGFRTGVIHPPLWELRDAAFTVPVLVHGPLLPVLLAPLLAAFGPGALDAMAWLAAAFAFATAVLIDRVVARRAGALAAATCVTLFTLSPLTLAAVHHDASMVVGAFFLLASIAAHDASRPRAVAAGVLVSVGALARPELAAAGVVLGVFAPAGTRWPFFVALLVPRLAWIAYRSATTGMPLFDLSSYLLVADTSRYPDLSALRRFDLTPDRFGVALRDALPAMIVKWANALPRAAKHALTAPNVVAGVLAAVAMVVTVWRGVARLRGGGRGEAGVGAGGAASEAEAAPAAVERPQDAETASLETSPLAPRDLVLLSIPLVLLVLTERRATLLVPFLPLWTWAAWRAASMPWRWGRGWLSVALVLLALPSGLLALARESAEARQAAAWLGRERVALAAAVAAWDSGGPFIGARSSGPEAGSASDTPVAPPSAHAPRAGPSRTRTVVVLSDTPDFVAWTTRRPTVWMTRDEWTRLETGTGAWPRGLPRPGSGASTWFHEDPRRYR